MKSKDTFWGSFWLFIRPPIRGDRQYDRSEILAHLDIVGRKILIPGFRSDNNYTLVDYLLVRSASIGFFISAILGFFTVVFSFFVYASGDIDEHPIFQSFYSTADFGFVAKYSVLHSLAAGGFVFAFSLYTMVQFALYARPVKSIFNVDDVKSGEANSIRHFRKLGWACLVLATMCIFLPFCVPTMLIDWFKMSPSVGDSSIYNFITFIYLIFMQGVGSALLFSSFLFFYAPKRGFLRHPEEQ